jgi:hypothetical protein
MSEYSEIADRQFEKMRHLMEEKERIDREMRAAKELARAAIKAMPDEEKGPYLAVMTNYSLEQFSLTVTIRKILHDNPGIFFTPVEVKEHLDARGYDFSRYKSNPLSSVHSILKRFKRSEVETVAIANGGTAYRWKEKRTRKETVRFRDLGRIRPRDSLAGLDKDPEK